MKTPEFFSFSVPVPVLLVVLVAAPVRAQSASTPAFEHESLDCIGTSAFPVVEAELDPAGLEDVRLAHVYFKSSEGRHWYYVDMERVEGAPRLRATLPKPLTGTNLDYYLFFITSHLESSQSEEYSVRVSESECVASPGAAVSPPSPLTLRATVANQPPIPAGFSPQGISELVTTAGNTVAVRGGNQ